MSASSAVLRSCCLFFFTVSSFVLLDSKEIPHEGFLDHPYHPQFISTSLEPNGGPGEDFAFGSRDVHTFPEQGESAFIIEDEAHTTQVWPRVILDYMKHQLRFRGRTKKSTKKDWIMKIK
ncbi:hypothetical protein PAMA_005930 [Pampus argenteus]